MIKKSRLAIFEMNSGFGDWAPNPTPIIAHLKMVAKDLREKIGKDTDTDDLSAFINLTDEEVWEVLSCFLYDIENLHNDDADNLIAAFELLEDNPYEN